MEDVVSSRAFGGRVGFYAKVHHAIADGVSGVALLGAFLDTHPAPRAARVPPWTPAPRLSTRQLFEDNFRRRWQALARAVSTLVRPVAAARRIRAVWPAVHETLAADRVPRTSINRPIGPGRTLAVVRSHLGSVRQGAHAYNATINDVLMAAVAGGLRDLLHNRGGNASTMWCCAPTFPSPSVVNNRALPAGTWTG